MRVSPDVQTVLNAAYQEALKRQHEYLTPEHILYAALGTKSARMIIEECGADPDSIREELHRYLKKHMPASRGAEPTQTLGFQAVIEQAVFHTETSQKGEVDIGDILVAIFDLKESHGAYLLKKAGISKLELLQVISHGGIFSEEEETGEEEYYNDEAQFRRDDFRTPAFPRKREKNVLSAFTTELTQLAREGKLEPLIGREDIIERTVQVLCRRLKNNPVFVGDPGVGKTAIVEGLAQRIAEGRVPSMLKGFRIYAIDMGSMIAGTRFRGDFEERMKRVLKALQEQDRVILFIDEIHTVVGAGAVSGGSMDASNLLKPALQSGNLRCIGSTTYDEYKKYFDKDRALSRRFQKIEISETTKEETYDILRGLKEKYEAYHNVVYTDEALRSAVELSSLYITDRFLPDKAIDVIDEAGAYMKITSFQNKDDDQNPRKVTEREIEKVVAKIARIPEKTVSRSEIDRLKNLAEELKKVIFGQDQAVDAVAEAVKRSRAGFREEGKPIASFLFVGPTGVGKTELARQLAAILGISMHRFDMSEYQEKHTVARLIGSPPGYVGYEEGGLLTDAIRKTPHAVLLLDEIEKAHQDIFNVLLQIMDYATLTDNAGRKADFRNVIIIMTSNAGTRDLGKPIIGFSAGQVTEKAVTEAIEKTFSPEFRNRLDRVVYFNRLSEDVVLQIVDKELNAFKKILSEKGVNLEVTDECRNWLARTGYSPVFGARNISRLVQDKIKSFFVDEVLFGSLAGGGKAVADIEKDDVVIRVNH
ncbi:MAG: ATP-dependent Clp protease ATP-binding subunit ClpA [Spirochaetota bacterium]